MRDWCYLSLPVIMVKRISEIEKWCEKLIQGTEGRKNIDSIITAGDILV